MEKISSKEFINAFSGGGKKEESKTYISTNNTELIPLQDNCLNCIHNNVCYKSAWQKEPCKDKIEDNANSAK